MPSSVTDTCLSWISGRGRMTLEMISWSISTKECCRTQRGSNPRRPDHLSGAHPTEPQRPAYTMMRNLPKGPLCYLRTMQVEISLRISAGWSGPSLPAYRINGYCSICRRTENVQIRLHGCACWSGPTLSTNCIGRFFALCINGISNTSSCTRQLPFLNQRKRKGNSRNNFMINLHQLIDCGGVLRHDNPCGSFRVVSKRKGEKR